MHLINHQSQAAPFSIHEFKELKNIYLPEDFTSVEIVKKYLLQKYENLKKMSRGELFILALTVAFMVICGMTTGGFIIEQLGGDNPKDWHKAMGVLGSIISGNAQKDIFWTPLQNLAKMYEVGFFTGASDVQAVLIIGTLISAVCSFMINYGLGSFGAKIFIMVVLGASGPPGWLAIAFSIFFALMNALLVLSGTLEDIKNPAKASTSQVIGSLAWNFFLKTFTVIIALWGLLMTFYTGADEVATKFGGLIVAGILLIGALWTEGYYAYRKAIDAATVKHMPSWSWSAIWNKLCAVLNAVTVGFQGAEGGERGGQELGISETDRAEMASMQAVSGAAAGFVSYAYTLPSKAQQEADEPKRIMQEKTALIAHQFKQWQKSADDTRPCDVEGVWRIRTTFG